MAPDDVETFETALEELHRHFQSQPFHYTNEHPLAPELHRLLRERLSPEVVPVDYRQSHSDIDQWRNCRPGDEVSAENQRIPRVRPEVTFYSDGVWGGAKSDFDLTLFVPDDAVVLQGKKQSVGGFVDADEIRLSVLCEIKHSTNMGGSSEAAARQTFRRLRSIPALSSGAISYSSTGGQETDTGTLPSKRTCVNLRIDSIGSIPASTLRTSRARGTTSTSAGSNERGYREPAGGVQR